VQTNVDKGNKFRNINSMQHVLVIYNQKKHPVTAVMPNQSIVVYW